ncbi:MAG: acetyl ornithine aminotransferase family protein [Planctomycetota bacterium]|jgi:4-aminobutyrate aminotransferase
MLGIRPEQTPKSDDTWIGPAPWIEGTIPGPIAKTYIASDEGVSSPSYTRDYPLVVKRAVGSVVEDVDGNRFLDLSAGIAVCATGHCHPHVVQAIKEQAENLIHICGADFYYPSMATVMEKLAAIVPGKKPKRVFLTNSGTETVEAAIKLARFTTKRKYIVGFYGAFHGRTLGSLSLTSSKSRQREGFGPLLPMVAHVPYQDVDAIENHLFKYQINPGEVAAIVVEAIQGEGGYIVPDAEFLPKLRTLCDKHGILLVCDEIQSGMGRTGKWFAFEHFGIEPDMVLIAKGIASGMPLGALVTRADVMDWPPGAHASTFGGNPVCCAAATATIELIEAGLLSNAATLGATLKQMLEATTARMKCLSNPRGIGLMCAVDVVNPRSGCADPARREKIAREAFQRGIIVLPCGETAIRFCPPLCINQAQLEVGLKLFEEAVATAS